MLVRLLCECLIHRETVKMNLLQYKTDFIRTLDRVFVYIELSKFQRNGHDLT